MYNKSCVLHIRLIIIHVNLSEYKTIHRDIHKYHTLDILIPFPYKYTHKAIAYLPWDGMSKRGNVCKCNLRQDVVRHVVCMACMEDVIISCLINK